MALLSIVIGIVFVMLLFSLLATTVMELLAGLLSLRGKELLSAIQEMIGGLKTEFIEHPFFQQLTIGSSLNIKGKAFPSYLSSWNFSAILVDIMEMHDGETIKERIETLPEKSQIRKILMFLYKQTGEDIVAFKQKTEEWFNEVMDRASAAYKRKMRNWLFAVGICIAVTFNVDVLTVYHNLSINAALREFVADQATQYVNNNPRPADTLATTNYTAAREKIGTLVNDNIGAISSPLGLGWDQVDWSAANNWRWWLYRLAGWLTTAMAISLGATFWFDLLRKLVGIRGGGAAAPINPAPTPYPTNPQAPIATISPVAGGSFLTKAGPDSPFEKTAAKPPKEKKTRVKKVVEEDKKTETEDK